MPLIVKEKISPHSEYFIWHITEEEEFFLDHLVLDAYEQQYHGKLIETKRKEFLACRYLLHLATGEEQRVFLDISKSGKPFLQNRAYEISLSHSASYVAVVLSNRLVGIDIQRMNPKLERIKGKFISEEEFGWYDGQINTDIVHHFWGAKEALFKAYGNGKVEFRRDLKLTRLPNDLKNGCGMGKVIKDDLKADFDIHCRKIEDYFIAIAEQKKESY